MGKAQQLVLPEREAQAQVRAEIALYARIHPEVDTSRLIDLSQRDLAVARQHFERGHYIQLRAAVRAIVERLQAVGLSHPVAVGQALCDVADLRRTVETAALLERLGRILRHSARAAAECEPPGPL